MSSQYVKPGFLVVLGFVAGYGVAMVFGVTNSTNSQMDGLRYQEPLKNHKQESTIEGEARLEFLLQTSTDILLLSQLLNAAQLDNSAKTLLGASLDTKVCMFHQMAMELKSPLLRAQAVEMLKPTFEVSYLIAEDFEKNRSEYWKNNHILSICLTRMHSLKVT